MNFSYWIQDNKWVICVIILGAMTASLMILAKVMVNMISRNVFETMVVSSMFCFPIWIFGIPIALDADDHNKNRNYYKREPDWRRNGY